MHLPRLCFLFSDKKKASRDHEVVKSSYLPQLETLGAAETSDEDTDWASSDEDEEPRGLQRHMKQEGESQRGWCSVS